MLRNLIITCVLLPATSFAFFCPTNFTQINFGDTVAKVKQQCGEPAQEANRDEAADVMQTWDYYMPQQITSNNGTQMPGMMKMSILFDTSGKVANITMNGMVVPTINVCNNIVLQTTTSTIEQVQQACGKPAFINKQSAELAGKPVTNKITELTYTSNPPVTLIFVNGLMTEKR